MPRLPKQRGDDRALALYTKEQWARLAPFYDWWAGHRWSRTLDFLRANHWRMVETVGDNLDDLRIPKWRRFPIIGLTLGVYSDQLAQWLESEVRYSATAASGDPADIARAEMAEGLLRYLWDLTEMDMRRIELGAWLLSTGVGSLGPYWDTNTGDMIPLAIQETVPGEDGTPVPTGRLVPVNPETLRPDRTMSEPVLVDAGEIAVETLNPQLTRYGQRYRDGCMTGGRFTYDEVLDIYGKGIAEQLDYQRAAGPVLDTGWLYGSSSYEQEERTLLIRHFIPKSSRYPKGLWWTATENGLSITPGADLPSSRYPIVPFRWVPAPGHWAFGFTPLYEVTHANKGAELAKQKQQEWMEKVLPKLLLKAGGGVGEGDFDNTPGQELGGVHPGAEPEWLSMPTYPPQFDQQRQDSIEEGLLAAGYRFRQSPRIPQGEPTRGAYRAPKEDVTPKEARLALLSTKPSWRWLGKILLGIVGRFYTDDRTISVVGPDRTYQLIQFRGTDFANLPTDIHVDEIPYYPWNRQTMRDTVVALLGTPGGQLFFQDADGRVDTNRLHLAAEAVGVDVALSTLNPDVMEARNEVGLIRTGAEVAYEEYQNSEVHLDEKYKVMKSMAFRGWPKEAQQALAQNVAAHQEALQEQQAQAEQAMMAQEQRLREIRARTEAMGEAQKGLAQMLLDVFEAMMLPPRSPTRKE